MKTGFLFLLLTTSWPVVYISQEWQEPSIMSWKWHNVQRARSEMRCCTIHALYQSKLWQQDHCQHPQNANPDGSTCPEWWKQSFRLWLSFLVWFQVRATTCHLTSSKSAWKSTPKYIWMCWRVWWSPGAIRWLVADPGCGSRTWHRPTSPKRPRLNFRRSATTLYPSLTAPPSSPDLNPLDYFVWSYVENITNMTSHNTKASLIAAIRRGPTGACGKGILPVPDPYWGGDWGWWWLHWIDVSSTT